MENKIFRAVEKTMGKCVAKQKILRGVVALFFETPPTIVLVQIVNYQSVKWSW